MGEGRKDSYQIRVEYSLFRKAGRQGRLLEAGGEKFLSLKGGLSNRTRYQSVPTEGGHRRYDIDSLIDFRENRKTVAYARVSSHDQKNDLERQALVLEAYCLHHGYNFEIIKDLGSGLNYKKRGLQKILQLIVSEQIDRLVITNKDRLLRFGAELIFSLCEHFGVEIVILNRKEDASYEEDLAKDVLEIITVFSARLYGSRSRRNQKILEQLIRVVDPEDESL